MKKLDYSTLFTLRSDGRYMGYYKDADGKRHALYDRDPQALYFKIQDKENPTAVTFKQAAEEWENDYRETVSVRTWQNMLPHYKDMIKEYGGDNIADITGKDVLVDLQRAKAKGYSKTVVNSRRVIFNGIFNHAVGKGYIPFNPALSVKLPKNLPHSKRRAPTDEEIKVICQNVDTEFGIFPFMLLCTGLRRNECLHLLKRNIDLKARTIDVEQSKTESGIRTVPIIDALVEPLKRQIEASPNSPYLFPAREYNGMGGKGWMSDTNYDTAWLNYCRRVGFVGKDGKPTLSAHNLRHGTATLMYEAGVDEFSTQRILGHAHISTTREIYTELREKKSATGVKRFNKLSKILSK